MNILVVADLHWEMSQKELEYLRSANNDCELYLLLGDIPLDQLILIKEILEIPSVGILGNHDTFDLLEKAGITNCHGRIVEIKGLRIAGISGSPRYTTDKNHVMYTQAEIFEAISPMRNKKIDILISHSGLYDKSADPAHVGFKAIKDLINTSNPSLIFHGHNHNNLITHYRNLRMRIKGQSAIPIIETYRLNKYQFEI